MPTHLATYLAHEASQTPGWLGAGGAADAAAREATALLRGWQAPETLVDRAEANAAAFATWLQATPSRGPAALVRACVRRRGEAEGAEAAAKAMLAMVVRLHNAARGQAPDGRRSSLDLRASPARPGPFVPGTVTYGSGADRCGWLLLLLARERADPPWELLGEDVALVEDGWLPTYGRPAAPLPPRAPAGVRSFARTWWILDFDSYHRPAARQDAWQRLRARLGFEERTGPAGDLVAELEGQLRLRLAIASGWGTLEGGEHPGGTPAGVPDALRDDPVDLGEQEAWTTALAEIPEAARSWVRAYVDGTLLPALERTDGAVPEGERQAILKVFRLRPDGRRYGILGQLDAFPGQTDPARRSAMMDAARRLAAAARGKAPGPPACGHVEERAALDRLLAGRWDPRVEEALSRVIGPCPACTPWWAARCQGGAPRPARAGLVGFGALLVTAVLLLVLARVPSAPESLDSAGPAPVGISIVLGEPGSTRRTEVPGATESVRVVARVGEPLVLTLGAPAVPAGSPADLVVRVVTPAGARSITVPSGAGASGEGRLVPLGPLPQGGVHVVVYVGASPAGAEAGTMADPMRGLPPDLPRTVLHVEAR